VPEPPIPLVPRGKVGARAGWALAACRLRHGSALAVCVSQSGRRGWVDATEHGRCLRGRQHTTRNLGALQRLSSCRERGGWEARCLTVQGQEQPQGQAPTCRRPGPTALSPSPPPGRMLGWRTRGCCRRCCCCTHCHQICCPAGQGTGPQSAGVGTGWDTVAEQGVGPQPAIAELGGEKDTS